MGTSTSSNGPSGGVSFDPPWLISERDNGDISISDTEQLELPLAPLPLQVDNMAPRARFAPARKGLNHYISSGDHQDLKKALGGVFAPGNGGSNSTCAPHDNVRPHGSRGSSFF